jgi:hypothetical protein
MNWRVGLGQKGAIGDDCVFRHGAARSFQTCDDDDRGWSVECCFKDRYPGVFVPHNINPTTPLSGVFLNSNNINDNSKINNEDAVPCADC